MPDLRAIIDTDRSRSVARRARQLHRHGSTFVRIDRRHSRCGLGAGQGPVPVDPDWGPISRTIAAPKRDLIAALAVNEIVETITDDATRARLNDAAIEAMRGAVDRIARMG